MSNIEKTKTTSTALSSTNDYGYVPWTPEQADADYREDEASKAGKWDTIPEGKSRRRFLPALHGMLRPFQRVPEHDYEVGDRRVRHVCPMKSLKKPCPSCRDAAALRQSGHAADSNRAYKMSVKDNTYWLTVDPDAPELGVRVLSARPRKKGGGLFEPLLSFKSYDRVDFTHPTEGRLVHIKRTGTKRDTTYTAKLLPEPHSLAELGDGAMSVEEWFDMAYDLREFANVPTADEIQAMIEGDDEEDDDKPRRPRGGSGGGRSTARRSSAQDDIEDEDDATD